ncbi:MAG: hypothetical protein GWN87_08690 [Desulfuromonadales bacterium]|nr:hypothetical protein [Desulfuromonadales bacterium]
MEGISVERGADGGLRLWMISDDNFNIFQRTMLVLLEIDDLTQPAAMTGQGGSG